MTMTRGKHRLAVAAAALVVVAAAGVSRGTFAVFSGQVRNPDNTFALTSLYAPGGLTVTPLPRSVGLTWTPGQNGSAYRVLSAPAPNPQVDNCAGASFSTLATPAATNYTHAAWTPQGTWRCYLVQTAHHSWTSVENNPGGAAQLGFVATSAEFTNSGNARIDGGYVFTITFNHPVAVPSGPQPGNTICWTNDRIVLGSVQNGTCAPTDSSPRLGFLSGGTIDGNYRLAATWGWSNDNRTLTITVGGRLSGGGNYGHAGAWTFTPTPNTSFLQSATGSHHACDNNAGGGNCTPVVNGL